MLFMKYLPNVTLITVDCLHLERSKAAADICERHFSFGKVVILSSIKDSDPRVVPIEEIKDGKSIKEAVHEGFARAWPSIRDSNISSMITAIILFWFGTSLIKGFALVFGLGVLISMLTAITVSRTLLLALGVDVTSGFLRTLFGSGLTKI